jgi:hypothetical protein
MEDGTDKEYFNFSCVLRGKVMYLEQSKECVIREYVGKGHVTLVRPFYHKKELYIRTVDQLKEYQTLKNKEARLIGAGFSS